MQKFKFLGIAPYEELKQSMATVEKQFDEFDIDIYTADLEKGQLLAQNLVNQSYDAIISRGGTADFIQQVVDIPVIDVSISLYDILGAIRLAHNYTQHLAIVGYSSITEAAHLICDILQYSIKIVTITADSDTEMILENLREENYEMILCDVVTNKIALQKSFNTILITSGFESIKHAYRQAISLVNHLGRCKQQLAIFEETFSKQSQKTIILEQNLTPIFSNLDEEIVHSVCHFLQTRQDLSGEKNFYHTFQTTVYNLKVYTISVQQRDYYCCEVKVTTPPLINNRFGVTYLSREDVETTINDQLLFTSFIQEKSRQLIHKLTSFYNAMMIFGESGTAKTSLAYTAFLQQKDHNNNLITINSSLMTDKMWKFLLNPNKGPLVEINNTLLFTNIEQMPPQDVERLLTIITNTKLLHRNNIIFIYNTNQGEQNEQIFNQIMTELDCASIYSPSIKERKNELSSIVTRLLNRLNITCNKEVIGFEPNAMREILDFDWSGNLNQLEQVLKHLILNSNSYYITEHQVVEALSLEDSRYRIRENTMQPLSNFSENKTLFDYTREIILAVLEKNDGNQTKTAQQLGIGRTTLWRYLKLD